MSVKTNSDAYDLAIVGAGIIGIWVAKLACQRWPNKRILLVDQSLIGSGATHYSLGMHYLYAENPRKQSMVLQSKALWEDLIQEYPELAISKHPFYFFTSAEKKNDICPRFVGTEIVPLSSEDIKILQKNQPWLRSLEEQNRVKLAFSGGEAMRILPEIVPKLAAKLKNADALNIYEGTKVKKITCSGEKIRLETASNQIYQTKKVVLTMGPWITSFLKPSSMRNKKIVSLHFEGENKASTTDPIFFWPEEPAFLLANATRNQWILSFKAEEWDSPPDINQLIITEQDIAKGFALLDNYCPDLKANFRGGRVFCDVYQDNLPTPHYWSGSQSVVIAGAGSGIGFRLAPAIAWETLEALSSVSEH